MTNIYFINHSQASFGTDNDDRLSDTGTTQAQVLGDYFIAMEAYFPAIYSGSKQNRVETANMIVTKLKDKDIETNFNILPELDGFDASSLLETYKDDILRSDPSIAKDLENVDNDQQSYQNMLVKVMQWSLSEECDGTKAENFQSFKNRIHSAIKKIIDESRHFKKVAVVTSGDVIAVIMQMVEAMTDIEVIDSVWNFNNASITMCYVEGDQLELRLENSTIHLTYKRNDDLLTYI